MGFMFIKTGLHFVHMKTQARVITSFRNKERKQVRIRSTTNPEATHKEIYNTLNSDPKPGKKIKSIH